MPKLLLVENDLVTADAYRRVLQDAGFSVDVATSLDEAQFLILRDGYGAMVINVNLSPGEGLEVVRLVRESGRGTPVLAVSSLGTTAELVRCLDAGADEFAAQPIDPEELRARVSVLVRRANGASHPDEVRLGNVSLSRLGRRVTCGSTELSLTAREYSLLEFLMLHAGDTISRIQLLEAVWQRDSDGSNVIEARLVKLRRKLRVAGADIQIKTRRNLGYLLQARAS